jgi:DNA-binding transcriptional LysR family regulator
MERLTPALTEVEAAIDVVNQFRDRPVGWLRLNVPVAAVRLVLPSILPPFLAAYPDIRVEVTAQESLVDILAQGFDAGIRYEERLQKDMIAVPIGPRRQRAAAAASPAYLDKFGRPNHPRELLDHQCLRARFASGAMVPWDFELDGEVVRVEAGGQLVTSIGETTQLAVEVATKGAGIVCLFEEWLQPYFDSGALEPVLKEWWPSFGGPYLYYPSRAYLPAPLRAFVDFVASQRDAG